MIKMLRIRKYLFCIDKLQQYVLPSKIGGSSQDNLYSVYAGKFRNDAIQNMKKKANTTIITTPQQCKKCVQILKKVENIVAWDTQTIDLDIKNETPVGNGKIICASFFAGPQFNFGNGPRVFIDNFGTNAGLINYFKQYLQQEKYKKVWHNYGFDRHVFYNHGIDVRGLGGDTMHMARLLDPSKAPTEYSLAKLTQAYEKIIARKIQDYLTTKILFYQSRLQSQIDQTITKQLRQKVKTLQTYKNDPRQMKKTKMQNLFYRKKTLKTGKQGKTYEFPSILTLHTTQQYIDKWVQYSVLDAQSTFFLRQILQQLLKRQTSKAYEGIDNMFTLYQKHWLPFGQILTDMQRQGFKMNEEHVAGMKQKAQKILEQKKQAFTKQICKLQDDPNIQYFNPSSVNQMQQLLHAPFKIKMKAMVDEMDDEEKQLLSQAAEQEQQDPLTRKMNRKAVIELAPQAEFTIANPNPTKGATKLKINIKGFGIPPVKLTPKGLPSVDHEAILILAGSPKQQKYGKAYDYFANKGNPEFGIQVCNALNILVQFRNIQTLVKTFIEPLAGYIDASGRIHCSLNINTETGRLSARKPNLQNQPALQKDIFKIRQSFIADKGKKLIVADYGQLQLRVLAHLTNCKNMIKAFQQGGDFHSRTAIGMYDYIKKDMESGKVLLQWDKSKGTPPAPLIKEKYASQRRKAKTVNFSIAYGKTAKGFAQDWNCTVQQAKKVIQSWFADRQQVLAWQTYKQNIARTDMKTQTLLGRYRSLQKYFRGGNRNLQQMAMRRAINTPIQGGAADIVIAAMVKIGKNQRLKQLGWKLQLQIHDQLILQGPQQSSKEALQIVKYNMSHPFDKDLLIELEIDAKIGNNWYQCK